MRIALLILIMASVMFSPAAAGDLADIQSAQNSLAYTLSNLRNSVEKLTKENQELGAVNDRLRQQLGSLQNELVALQRDDSRLLEQYSSLEKKHKKKIEAIRSVEDQVARLKEEEVNLSKAMASISEEITDRERADADLGAVVEQKESEVSAAMRQPVKEQAADEPELIAARNRLLQKSRAGEVLLQRTRDEWLELQEVVQGGKQRLESLKKSKANLVRAIEGKEEECVQLADKVRAEQSIIDDISAPEKISPSGIAILEQELRSLNYKSRVLDKDLRAWQKGDNRSQMASEKESSELSKLEVKVNEMVERNNKLKAERDQLRRQMVNMDKKKARLEKAVYEDN